MEKDNKIDSNTTDEVKKPCCAGIFYWVFYVILGFLFFVALFVFDIFGFRNCWEFLKSYSSSDGNKSYNILLLGKSGGDNTAPDLTDTIMTVSVNPLKGKVSVISVPRDLWIPSIRAKINSSYYWGKEKNPDNPFLLVKDTVKEVSGIYPDGVVVVDFEALKGLVDGVGGIYLDVERDFTDNFYPIAGKENDLCNGDTTYACRYQSVEFKKGYQLMDGETTLKFVRSRNAQGEEGTDIARGLRQQKVIIALKEKLTNVKTILSFWNYKKIADVVFENTTTDMNVRLLGNIIRSLTGSLNNIETLAVPEELLKIYKNDKKYDNQYVFVPKTGNFNEITQWFKEVLEGK